MTARQHTGLDNRFKDITGQRFGRLTVLRECESRRNKKVLWVCLCDCGNIHPNAQGCRLRNGSIQSCGCLAREVAAAKIGRVYTGNRKEFRSVCRIWDAMKRRCLNPSSPAYHLYGGRGITVCDRWRDSCGAFIEDMGPRPSPKHSIDRIDNDGNYEPGNCRWATSVEQQNNRRDNVFLEHDGRRLTIAQWARSLGVRPRLIELRLKRGWDVVRALTTSPIPSGHKAKREEQ